MSSTQRPRSLREVEISLVQLLCQPPMENLAVPSIPIPSIKEVCGKDTFFHLPPWRFAFNYTTSGLLRTVPSRTTHRRKPILRYTVYLLHSDLLLEETSASAYRHDTCSKEESQDQRAPIHFHCCPGRTTAWKLYKMAWIWNRNRKDMHEIHWNPQRKIIVATCQEEWRKYIRVVAWKPGTLEFSRTNFQTEPVPWNRES